ncbi:MAG: hypothetical protein ACRDL5_13870 [Solirubrobacteraceae bacterium]
MAAGIGGVLPVAASAQPTSTSYTTPGQYTFTVPAGVSALSVTATGGQGGESTHPDERGDYCAGGEGAVVSGVLPVSAGEVLYVEIGGAGTWSPTGAAAANRGV